MVSIYQTIKYCCAEETDRVLKIWLRNSVFLWKLAFFSLRGTILSFFRPTWGNIYWFLVVFLDMNRLVCIWKRVHTKSKPTGTSSSWFATCLNEVGFSLQLLFVFALFRLPLDFSLLYASSNPVGNQLCKAMNWLEVIGLVFSRVGRKMCFSRQNISFRKTSIVLNCFLSDSNSGFSGLSGCGFYLPDY